MRSATTSKNDERARSTEPDGTDALNRISEVRRQQQMSLRTAARHMGTDIRTVRSQEEGSADLRLSDLYKWQEALKVPVADLLVDPGSTLSRPVLERARLLRLMKTVQAIREQSHSEEGVQRMADTLAAQLIEIMPELEDVSAWHTVGQRRSMNEYGKVMEQTIPDGFFNGQMVTSEAS